MWVHGIGIYEQLYVPWAYLLSMLPSFIDYIYLVTKQSTMHLLIHQNKTRKSSKKKKGNFFSHHLKFMGKLHRLLFYLCTYKSSNFVHIEKLSCTHKAYTHTSFPTFISPPIFVSLRFIRFSPKTHTHTHSSHREKKTLSSE